MEKERCGNCKYFNEDCCRRYAPRPKLIITTEDNYVQWPELNEYNWCGEWVIKV
jgi:hypothetical protein